MEFSWIVNKKRFTCDWCEKRVSQEKPNYYYKAVYGEWYDPNDKERSRMVKEHVCDKCWSDSVVTSASYVDTKVVQELYY